MPEHGPRLDIRVGTSRSYRLERYILRIYQRVQMRLIEGVDTVFVLYIGNSPSENLGYTLVSQGRHVTIQIETKRHGPRRFYATTL